MGKRGKTPNPLAPVDEKFSMRTPKVTKKFRFLYNKGVVHDDGTITSFYN